MVSSPGSNPERRVRPPRALNLVPNPRPDEVGAAIDWSSWYLTDEDDVGQGCEQDDSIHEFRLALETLARERGWQNVRIGVDAFFAWVPSEPLVRVSPDVYLLDDPPPPPLPKSWQTWLAGHRPPRFALEVVSEEWKEDYELNPQKYAQLGAQELVIFDVEAAAGAKKRNRLPLQVYRRDPDGAFVRVYAGAGPTRSAELDATLVVEQRPGPTARLRLARDAEGRDIVPTAAEELERERAARESAEAELIRLKAELERRGG